MASNSSLVKVCTDHGYNIEYQKNFDGTEDRNTVVVSFPTSTPNGTILAKNMTAVDQLEVIKRLQKDWSDNSVSVTIYYRKNELDDIRNWLSTNFKDIKSVSFLLHNEHGFVQAPMEEITSEEYYEMIKNTKIIKSVNQTINLDDMSLNDCEGGVCPVR